MTDTGRETLTGLARAAVGRIPASDAALARLRRYLTPLSAVCGAALLAWLLARVGMARLVELWAAARPLLPPMIALTGLRYGLQAAGWRLALPASERPRWRPALAGVVAGEAAGYVAGGTVAREPVKLLFVRGRVPPRVAFAGAAIERLASMIASAVVVASAAAIATARLGSPAARWAVVTFAATVAIAVGRRARPTRRSAPRTPPQGIVRRTVRSTAERMAELWNHRRPVLATILGLALAQELVSLAEAYLVLTWLGASPVASTIILFEGSSRLINALGQFVPGRVGVTEGTNALVASMLGMAPVHGVSLALMRRARSLVWALAGLSLLMLRGAGRGTMRAIPVSPVA